MLANRLLYPFQFSVDMDSVFRLVTTQQNKLWRGLEAALMKDYPYLESPAKACLHLLCYMICLSAVAVTIPSGK